MTYNPEKHHRRSIRLEGYDYSKSGVYFVTICAQNRVCLFGHIVDGKMHLNDAGQIVADSWQWLALQYDYVELDEWVIMPNHLHGIIVITDDDVNGGGRGGSRTAPTGNARNVTPKRKPIGRLIGAFKTVSTKHINILRGTPNIPIWQRNYYEHIIRNDESLNHIREYIINNPIQWELDRENPNIVGAVHEPAPPKDEPWYI